MIKPIKDNILIKPDEVKETTKSGIIVSSNQKEPPATGTIIEVGEDVTELKKGDRVYFKKFTPDEITIDNETYLVGQIDCILAIIQNEK